MAVRKKIKEKKGIYYTVISIVLLGAITAFLFLSTDRQYTSEEELHIQSVKNVADYLLRFESQAEDYAKKYTEESLDKMINEVKTTGFLQDYQQSFNNYFLNSSENNSFPNFIKVTEAEAGIRGISLDIEIINTSLKQIDPFFLETDILLRINASNKAKDAFWNYELMINAIINIEGFEDPLYIGESGGQYVQKIHPVTYEPFVDGTDTLNLKRMYLNSHYYWSSDAPSFLKRFEGSLQGDRYGLESFVIVSKLPNDLQRNKTLVDHLYFSTTTTTDRCNIQNMPSSFRIDNNHVTRYGLNGLEYESCS